MARIFAKFTDEGFAVGFWREDFYDVAEDVIPADAIEITNEQWQDFLANQGHRKWIDGEVVAYEPPPRVPTKDDVNRERERRIAAGVTVTVTGAGDIPVQGREVDVRNLQGLGLAALARVSTGDTATITIFRDANNVDHSLTPQQVLELVQLASSAAEAIIAASWAIKAMDPLPEDVTADELWRA